MILNDTLKSVEEGICGFNWKQKIQNICFRIQDMVVAGHDISHHVTVGVFCIDRNNDLCITQKIL